MQKWNAPRNWKALEWSTATGLPDEKFALVLLRAVYRRNTPLERGLGQRGQPLMISEPRKIKLLESVVEAGKRWKLVKLLGACDLFAFFSVRTSHRLVEETYFHRPYRSKPAEYLFELAWGVNTRKYGDLCVLNTPNNQVPMLTTARTRRHQGVWGLLTPVWWVSDRQEMSRLSPGALQTSSDLPLSQMSIFPPPPGRAPNGGRLVCPLHFRAEHVSTTSDPGWGIISDCRSVAYLIPLTEHCSTAAGGRGAGPTAFIVGQAVYHADCDALFTTIRDHPPMNTTPPKPAAPVRLLLRPTDCEIGVISRYSGLFPVPTAIFMHLSPDMALVLWWYLTLFPENHVSRTTFGGPVRPSTSSASISAAPRLNGTVPPSDLNQAEDFTNLQELEQGGSNSSLLLVVVRGGVSDSFGANLTLLLCYINSEPNSPPSVHILLLCRHYVHFLKPFALTPAGQPSTDSCYVLSPLLPRPPPLGLRRCSAL
ncbi:hypothetical protein PAPYR_6680 [Paratrimastix pyriformis]|uniref:Uncharacterized protein n=1 Tax=Paratrimastix pyriformis TaxID=342808 RepID=A0ABQ8UET6_9EUKA|nr:hypothetical protein PAPYR_6680 [Paratrimastix pyriformis]